MTDQALAAIPQQALVFDNPTRDLIKKAVSDPKNPLTSDEFELFCAVAQHMGANPLLREIYALKTGGKLVIAIGIDQHRKQAQRSPRYLGQVGPFWCGDDGVWHDVWLSTTPPAAAKVGILLHGASEPTWGIARWKTFARQSQTWQAMPDHMLAIRAEAFALRKCFSRELGSVELLDDDTPGVTSSVVTPPAISAPVTRVLTEDDFVRGPEDGAPDEAPAQPPPAPKPAAARTKPAPVGKPDAAKPQPAQPVSEAPATSESQRSASETPVVPDLTADDPLMVQARDIYKKCQAAKLNPTKPEPPLTEDRVIKWMEHWYQALDQHIRGLQKAQDEAAPSQDEAWEDLGNGR